MNRAVWRERVLELLARPRLGLWLAALGALLVAPSLGIGLCTEDWLFAAASQHPFSPLVFNLYNAQDVAWGIRVAQNIGALPWITAPDFAISFWRPLSSLTHRADYQLLLAHPWLMHAENLALYAGLIAVVHALYRRLIGATWAAGLATFLFAVDQTHGQTVGWLSSRHILMGTLFGVGALVMHDRWRRGDGRGRWLAPLLLGLGLVSSEMAIGTLGYLVGYALSLESARGWARLKSLLPMFAVGGLWLWVVRALGHGARGSGMYINPLQSPGDYFSEFPGRAAAALLRQSLALPADMWHVLGATGHGALGGVALALALLIALAARKALRRDPALRCLGIGAAISLVIACASFPNDRTLMFFGVGFSGFAARLIARWREARDQPDAPFGKLGRKAAGALAALWLLALGVVGPLNLPGRSLNMAEIHAFMQRSSDTAYAHIQSQDQRLIVVNAPDFYFGKMVRDLRWSQGHKDPAALLNLAGSVAALRITRVDPNAIEVRPAHGFLDRPFNRLYRARNRPMRVGEQINLATAQVTVREVDAEGEPLSVLFRFFTPLENPHLRFVRLVGGRYESFTPPPVGKSVVITGTLGLPGEPAARTDPVP